MSDALKTFTFAGVLCLVCSLLLTAASSGLKEFQMRNVLVDKHRNILTAGGLIDETRSYKAAEIEALYAKNIERLQVDPAGVVVSGSDRSDGDLPLYVYQKDGTVEAYIVPIDTRGLWGKIHGYLALENDGSTIRGFTVYKHSETPGLGGEIERRWFRKNFKGKKIVNRAGEFVSISIAKGAVNDVVPKTERANYVDGISGATLTGKFLTAGLKDILTNYEPVAIRFRKHPGRIDGDGRAPKP